MDRYRIVLADDHVLIRQALGGLIKVEAGLEVIGEAGDGIELLSLLNTVTPHMVILDISMPNLRGIEAVSGIRKKYPEVKILILTMHKEYVHQALSAGADGYLLKEDADRDLFSAIENIRQGRVYLSPRLAGELFGKRAPLTEPLSVREIEVLKLIAQGKSNKEIAETLFISVRTAESHRAAILKKLNLKNTADLVNYAIHKGYI
ncbi:response regulator transcription factor [Geobacter sp.]|uniref:response regulator n=1 Tax=Geobacter sp. TaxID=46610 RepID=UPI001AC5DBFC|nr:response regulator transcription factor [Geobacter sp.]CAG1016388.1 Oxygen regulatory protein NreC [Anaerolineales bacterium]